MQKKKQPLRTESDTGEIFLITQKQKPVDKESFVKLYTETIYELCKLDQVGSLPLGFIVWLCRNLDFDGYLQKSMTECERALNLSHNTVYRLFKVAENAELLIRVGKRGTFVIWALNPKYIHKGDTRQKQRNRARIMNDRFEYDIKNERIESYEIETV